MNTTKNNVVERGGVTSSDRLQEDGRQIVEAGLKGTSGSLSKASIALGLGLASIQRKKKCGAGAAGK